MAALEPAPVAVEVAVVSAVFVVTAETLTVRPEMVEPPSTKAWLVLLSSVTAPVAPPMAPVPSTSVVTVVVLVEVMLRVPVLLPALTVDPPPTWATADELTTDSAIAASPGLRALPPMVFPTVGEESIVATESASIVTLPLVLFTESFVEDPVTVTAALGSRSATAAATPNEFRFPPSGALYW